MDSQPHPQTPLQLAQTLQVYLADTVYYEYVLQMSVLIMFSDIQYIWLIWTILVSVTHVSNRPMFLRLTTNQPRHGAVPILYAYKAIYNNTIFQTPLFDTVKYAELK